MQRIPELNEPGLNVVVDVELRLYDDVVRDKLLERSDFLWEHFDQLVHLSGIDDAGVMLKKIKEKCLNLSLLTR